MLYCYDAGERRRNLLQGLTQTLPETLPFLYKVIALCMQMMHRDCRYYLPHALFALFVEVCDLDCVLQQKTSNIQLLSRWYKLILDILLAATRTAFWSSHGSSATKGVRNCQTTCSSCDSYSECCGCLCRVGPCHIPGQLWTHSGVCFATLNLPELSSSSVHSFLHL